VLGAAVLVVAGAGAGAGAEGAERAEEAEVTGAEGAEETEEIGAEGAEETGAEETDVLVTMADLLAGAEVVVATIGLYLITTIGIVK